MENERKSRKMREGAELIMPCIIILIVGFLFTFIIIISLDISTINEDIDYINYCQDNGWDGSVVDLGRRYCFREIPHESGMGIETIYSGELKWKT